MVVAVVVVETLAGGMLKMNVVERLKCIVETAVYGKLEVVADK